MRVLIIIDNLSRGGKERRLVELLLYFSAIPDLKITLVLLSNIILYDEVSKISNVDIVCLKRRVKKDPLIFFHLFNIIKKTKPDIFHSWGSMPSIYTFLFAKMFHVPFLNAMITNAFNKPFSKDWRRALITFPFSDIILSNSYAGLKAFHVFSKKGRVIPNGFNPERLKLKSIGYAPNIDSLKGRSEIKVGMIGAFHLRKDYDLFLEVSDDIAHTRKDIIFIAAGDGNLLPKYKLKYQNQDQIIFTGDIRQIEQLIDILDIGVLLTNNLRHKEGISNALMEMMAFGKPVIATNDGGNIELIENNRTGLLVAPGSKADYMRALNLLISDKNLAKALGMNAKKRILSDFNIDSMGSKIYSIYQEMALRSKNKNG